MSFDEKAIGAIHRQYVDPFHNTHLKPLFLAVRRPSMDLCSLVIEGVDIADMLKAVTSLFAGENVVDKLSQRSLC